MATDNVISLAAATNRADLIDPSGLLAEASELIKQPDLQNSKVMIILLNDRNNEYRIRRLIAGMKSSEVLSLLECLKQITLQDMGYAK